MSLESNRLDFEKVLKDAKETIEEVWQLENSIDILISRVETLENKNIALEEKNTFWEETATTYED